jgi:deazaflavin-dependent oxidoreductase (nitroreductase family)
MSESSSSGAWPWLNRVMKFILRSPFHSPVSRTIMLITFTGRKSGRTYTTPVSYLRENGVVTLFTHGVWWKNLIGGAPVTLRIQGKNLQGTAEPVTDDQEAKAESLLAMLRHNPRDAPYYGVTFDENGQPNPDELARGARDAVMVRIQLTGEA